MKTSLDSSFKMNDKEKEDGKWFFVSDEVEFKVRSSFSDVATSVRRRLDSGFKGKIPIKVQEQITLRHISEGIVIDWRGLTVDGEPAGDYDPKVMEEMLSQMPSLVVTIAEISSSTESFQDDEIAKN